MLLSTSCATRPPAPPELLSIAWPILAPPPAGIVLDDRGGRVLVPLDYWTDLVGYIRAVENVRRILEREGRLLP
jgi:hypothetical protein